MFMTSPLNTWKKRNASQTSAIVLRSLLSKCGFDQGEIGMASVCSAVVMRCAAAKDVVRNLEVHGLPVQVV